MDSNSCQGNKKIDAIKKQINSGELTSDDIRRYLAKAMNTELSKPFAEIDNEYIAACQKLLNDLLNINTTESKQPQYERELVQRIEMEKPCSIRKKIYTTMAIAAALLIFSIVGQGLLSREWLEGSPSQDAQQYVVSGHEIDPHLINTGIASSDLGSSKKLATQSIDEAIAVLGFAPLLPTHFPGGWTFYTYYAEQNNIFQWFYEALTSSNHEHVLIFDMKKFSDVAKADEYLQQSELGTRTVVNGWDVYITSNIDEAVAIWIDGTVCYSLYGPLSYDEMIAVINSIKKGE